MAKGPFGEAVQAACAACQITQSDLALALGVSNGFLSDCLRGQRVFAQKHWLTLVKALPTLTLEAVADLALQTWPIKIDATKLSIGERAGLTVALAGIVRRRGVGHD